MLELSERFYAYKYNPQARIYYVLQIIMSPET